MRVKVYYTVHRLQKGGKGKTLCYTDKGRFSKDRRNQKLFETKAEAIAVCRKYEDAFLGQQPIIFK